jgi:drug/metabolite transporter superfamily protein YnfA
MGAGKRLISKLGIFGELLIFLWRRKLWWMIPMIVVLILFGLLLIFTQSSAVAPFIYTLF